MIGLSVLRMSVKNSLILIENLLKRAWAFQEVLGF